MNIGEIFSGYAGIGDFFSSYAGFFSRRLLQRVILFPVIQAILFSSYAGIHKDKTPQGQLEVTARRVEFIITRRGPAADTGAEEDEPF